MTIDKATTADYRLLSVTLTAVYAVALPALSIVPELILILRHWSHALCRVPPGHGKSWNLGRQFSRPGKSWKIAKVVESCGKVMENDDNVMEFLLLH